MKIGVITELSDLAFIELDFILFFKHQLSLSSYSLLMKLKKLGCHLEFSASFGT